jgi:predicted dehydrogenase
VGLRVGIAGRRGAAFYAGLRGIPEAELTALCDLDEAWLEREAREREIPLTFTRFEAMLDYVDAVVVATPMQLHAAHAVMALEAGKHVMSEVTAAVSLDECWRILDAQRSSGKVYFFSENYCYIRENVLVRAMVEKGLFGDVYYGEGEYLHDVKNLHHTPDGGNTWRHYWQVGVPGITYGTHSLGPVMQWFNARNWQDRVESVVCLGSGRHTDPEHPHDDTSTALCKLRSGKLIRIRLDMLSNRPHQMTYYALQGTHGVYESSRVPGQPGQIWLGENPPVGFISGEIHREWRPVQAFEEHLPAHWRNPPEAARGAGHGGGDYWVVRDFVDACLGEKPTAINVYDGLHWTAVGLCSTISLVNGGVPIRVPDFHDQDQRPLVLDGPPVIP